MRTGGMVGLLEGPKGVEGLRLEGGETNEWKGEVKQWL